ncbi:hypothetical protein [Flavobacterium sp.]|uniref:hypothetical protein n=1 Tax=Flavobacterium sp. TaxID=239 RepID=UPI0026044060|nr:hypothetical protein [Flavobacterium sp.]
MTDVAQILQAEFEKLKGEIAALYAKSASAGTGSWAQSLEVQVTEGSVTLLGSGYLEGRKPGKQPPTKAIEQWLQERGIADLIAEEQSVSGLAYVIARKIAREGWKPDKKGTELAAEVLTPQRIQQVIDRAGDTLISRFTKDIIDFLKQIAAK